MKFDLTMTHADYASHHGFHVVETLVTVWAAIKSHATHVLQALKPKSFEEEFLNRASNHADLERRMQVLMSPERWQGRWWD